MDIRAKLDYTKRAIDVIASHDDEDAAYRLAALDNLVAHCEKKKAEITAGLQERISAELE